MGSSGYIHRTNDGSPQSAYGVLCLFITVHRASARRENQVAPSALQVRGSRRYILRSDKPDKRGRVQTTWLTLELTSLMIVSEQIQSSRFSAGSQG
jgi:hypothetical protein